MRQLSGFYLLMVLIWAAPAGAQYLSAAPDIPLAEGLRENPDATLVFDKPQGRILQMSATQAVGANPTRTRQFYTASLPNLGWRARPSQDKNILTFNRKGETLRLSFRADTVIFDLTPKAPFED